MKKLIASLIYVIAQLYLLPLAAVGFVLVFYKQMFVSRRLGVSSTAVEVINGRWTMDIFGLRKDPATVKLNEALPNTSTTGLWLVLYPLYLRYKISGEHWGYPTLAERGKEGVSHLVFNRTIYFDEIINKLKGEAEQFVVMGAGFDTRCYGLLKGSDLALFELDQPRTQQLKRKCLAKADIDASHVHFAEVDFATENWYEALEVVGYDPTKKSIFLWEGVTLYLAEEDVRKTIQEIKAHTGPDSTLVCDLYAKKFTEGDYLPSARYSRSLLKITDEAFEFGLDFSADEVQTLNTFLASEDTTAGDTYFMGHNTPKGAYVVVAEVKL